MSSTRPCLLSHSLRFRHATDTENKTAIEYPQTIDTHSTPVGARQADWAYISQCYYYTTSQRHPQYETQWLFDELLGHVEWLDERHSTSSLHIMRCNVYGTEAIDSICNTCGRWVHTRLHFAEVGALETLNE